MKLIGLTGGIATGKTTVSKILMDLGIPVIDADEVYLRLSEKDGAVWKAVREAFGKEYFLPDGRMDRKALGELIFSNNQEREKLNRITHPLVKNEMLKNLYQITKERSPALVVMDVPLLFESGWNQWMDDIWVVYIPEVMQQARLMKRDNLTREEALLKIRSQMSIEQKRKLANRVIDNTKSLTHTKNQIEKIIEEFRRSQNDKT